MPEATSIFGIEDNFPHYDYEFKSCTSGNRRYILLILSKLLPDYIYDMIQMEGNPFTIPEICTVMEGITVGGHRLSDEAQIVNLKGSWRSLVHAVECNSFEITQSFSNIMHIIVGNTLAEPLGRFRDKQVMVTGTSEYICPKWHNLPEIFDSGLEKLRKVDNPIEKAAVYFLWAAYNQFYIDCNKRTARLMASGITLSSDVGIFTIPARRYKDFCALLIKFYDTLEANEILKFMDNYCFCRFDGDFMTQQVGGLRI